MRNIKLDIWILREFLGYWGVYDNEPEFAYIGYRVRYDLEGNFRTNIKPPTTDGTMALKVLDRLNKNNPNPIFISNVDDDLWDVSISNGDHWVSHEGTLPMAICLMAYEFTTGEKFDESD